MKARLLALNSLTLGSTDPAPSAPLEGTPLEEGDEVVLPEDVRLEEEVVEQMVGEVPMEHVVVEVLEEQVAVEVSEEQADGGHRLGPH